MNFKCITPLVALFAFTACGDTDSSEVSLESSQAELSMSVVIDGQARTLQVFHPATMSAGRAVSAAHALMANRLKEPRWLGDRIDLHYWIEHGGLERPQDQPAFDVCMEVDSGIDGLLCGNFSDAGVQGEQGEGTGQVGQDEENEAPKVEPRSLPGVDE